MNHDRDLEALQAVYKAACELVDLPPYPANRKRKEELERELASKVNDIRHPITSKEK